MMRSPRQMGKLNSNGVRPVARYARHGTLGYGLSGSGIIWTGTGIAGDSCAGCIRPTAKAAYNEQDRASEI